VELLVSITHTHTCICLAPSVPWFNYGPKYYRQYLTSFSENVWKHLTQGQSIHINCVNCVSPAKTEKQTKCFVLLYDSLVLHTLEHSRMDQIQFSQPAKHCHMYNECKPHISWLAEDAFYMIIYAVFQFMEYHWTTKIRQVIFQSVSQSNTINMNASPLLPLEIYWSWYGLTVFNNDSLVVLQVWEMGSILLSFSVVSWLDGSEMHNLH
jgi:hypothetical protein